MAERERDTWAERADAFALGEAGEPGAPSSPVEAREQALYEELSGWSQPVSDSADPIIASQIAAAWSGAVEASGRAAGGPATPPSSSNSARGVRVAMVAGALAMVAAVVLFVWGRGGSTAPGWRVESGQVDFIALATARDPDAGSTHAAGGSMGIEVGIRIDPGRALLLASGGSCLKNSEASACGGATVRVIDDDTLALDRGGLIVRGEARLNTQPVTLSGGSDATHFEVRHLVDSAGDEATLGARREPTESPERVRVRVEVFAGRVLAAADGERLELVAGELRVFERVADEEAKGVLARAEPSDPQLPSQHPVSPPPQAGDEAELSGDASASLAGEQNKAAAEATKARRTKARGTPKGSATNPSKGASQQEPAPSAAELLRRARQAKGKGDMTGARDVYEQLLRAHPQSPEAHAAHVSLGQLELRRGAAKSALRQFDAYLRKGGALSEEALWGRVQSLDRLGRLADRDAAGRKLMEHFPTSPYRARVEALGSAASSSEGAP